MLLIFWVLFLLSLCVFGFFSFRLLQRISPEQQSRHRKTLFSLLLAGILVRLAWIGYTQPEPMSDFLHYWRMAHAIAHLDFSPQGLIHTPSGGLLYSVPVLLFGSSLWAAWGLNLFFSLLLMVLMHQIVKSVLNETAALVALALTAFLPQLISYSALLSTEIPGIAFTMMTLWVVLDVFRHKTPAHWKMGLAVGLLLYASIMLRPASALLLLTMPLSMVWVRPIGQIRFPAKSFFAAFLSLLVLLFSGWLYYQHSLTGVLRVSWCNIIWMGAASMDKIDGIPSPSTYNYIYPNIEKDLSSSNYKLRAKALLAMESEFKKKILKNPLRYLKHGFARMYAILWQAKTGIVWTYHGLYQKRLAELSTQLWRVLLVMAVISSIFIRSRKTAYALGWTHNGIFLLFWMIFHYLFSAPSDRYAIQVIPFVILYASGVPTLLMSVRFYVWRKRVLS